MKIIEVANFSQAMPHLAATVLFDEKGKNPRVIVRNGYTHDKVWDKIAIQAAKKLLTKH